MKTLTRKNPLTNLPVEATPFTIWSWREGDKWVAACLEMKDVLIKTKAPQADAVKICFIRICNIVTDAKGKGEDTPWESWKPVTRGMYSVNKYSIS